VTLVALVNCGVFGSTPADCIDLGTCPGQGGDASTDGSLDGAQPDAVVPTGCDLLVEPKDSPPCVTDAVGVFVSPTGNDKGEGTRAAPFKTIGRAVNRAGKRRVYVCEGDYNENLVITKPTEIYGGFACTDFKHETRVVKVMPATSPAVAITGVTSAVRITDLEIVGTAEKDKAGASAIAVFASGASDVLFTRTVLGAGPGNDGEAGGTDANYTGLAPAGINSNAAAGGAGGVNACTDTSSSKGGNGGTATPATNSTPGEADPVVGIDNSGANGGNCTAGGGGENGAPREGGTGSIEHGKLEAAGFKTDATGSPGKSGNPGQGGGGGGYNSNFPVGGGGGGAGGCGGGGGRGGRTGGSSFALLSFQSTVAFEAGELSSGKGGKGGKGGAGGNGQAGGVPGAGAKCSGGTGGEGAGGSGGGGGGGGHSMPIAYVGAAPTLRSNMPSLKAGAPGEGGLGGGPGAGPGTPGNDGTAGDPGTAANVPTAL